MAAYRIEELPNNPSLSHLARLDPDIIFSNVVPGGLRLSLLTPWLTGDNMDVRYPLIVFVQGSAWKFPDINREIPQLADFARAGYVVATVTHRNALEGYPFPAYLQDVKTAIRFLRQNAAKYHIDPARVCIWGTSSGGNTALLVGLTGDEARYKTDAYAAQSDSVCAVVECFGPTDLITMFPGLRLDPANPDMSLLANLCGGRGQDEVFRDMSPVFHMEDGKKYPPVLILHGDADPVVPYAQGVEMLEKLTEAGAEAEMVRVHGAEHEGSFWSDALLARIKAFIDRQLAE